MKRRDFLKYIGIGVATAPVIAKAGLPKADKPELPTFDPLKNFETRSVEIPPEGFKVGDRVSVVSTLSDGTQHEEMNVVTASSSATFAEPHKFEDDRIIYATASSVVIDEL